jgi:hypothetical protein
VRNGKRDALSTVARDHGVRYFVIDQLQGGDPARLSGLGQHVFSNEAVSVFAVTPGVSGP